jgi:hypothetical protein
LCTSSGGHLILTVYRYYALELPAKIAILPMSYSLEIRVTALRVQRISRSTCCYRITPTLIPSALTYIPARYLQYDLFIEDFADDKILGPVLLLLLRPSVERRNDFPKHFP